MAGEITFSWRLQATKGKLDRRKSLGSQTIDWTTSAPNVTGGVQTVGFAAHEALPVTDLTTPGIAWFRNTDETNFVQVGVEVAATFYPFLKLKPGESFPVRLGATAIYAKADTAAVKLEYEILDV